MPAKHLVAMLLIASASSFILLTSSSAQGPLSPSGAPAPTMKSLEQVEPRTPITSLPFIITNAGSYYVTTGLTAGAGQHGIEVLADNVAIDLCGLTLTGSGTNSGSGILQFDTHRNLSVHNGKLVNWQFTFEAGLRALGPNGRFARLQLNANYRGARLGTDSLIQQCSVFSNLNDGIVTSERCIIEECQIGFNGDDGVEASDRNLIRRNTCQQNGGAGVHLLGSSNRAEDNHLTYNARGLLADSALSLIIRNVASGNTISNFDISAANTLGQILNVSGQTFTNANPWANLTY